MIHTHETVPLMKIIIDRKVFSNKLFFTFADKNDNVIMKSKGYKDISELIKGINFIRNECGNAYIIYKTTL